MTRGTGIDRRTFLLSVTAAGGALALGFDIPFGPPRARAQGDAPEVTAWIVIEPDDTVTIRVAKSEMGQGSFTALPMLVAEELECDWRKVKAEFASAHENARRNRVWGNMSTGASRAVSSSQQDLRRAGATARTMLIAAASARWNVPAAECSAANSVITHRPSGRTLTFGAVAEAAAALPPPAQVALKDPKDWKLIGTPQKRFEIADKVTGKPIYAIDVRLPDMLSAAIVQCPVFKGTLNSVDERALAGNERRAPDRQAPGRGGGRGGDLVAGEEGRRRSGDHLELRRWRAGVERHDPRAPAVGPRARPTPASAAISATPTRRSRRRSSGSRRTTRCRSSHTRPWSRRTAPRTSPPIAWRSGHRRRTPRPRSPPPRMPPACRRTAWWCTR